MTSSSSLEVTIQQGLSENSYSIDRPIEVYIVCSNVLHADNSTTNRPLKTTDA
eukprot:COSAG02_NODE_16275_length_1097_cov_1.150301_1_plen_53_part_00